MEAAVRQPARNRGSVLAKCSYFVDVQLWPILESLDPERWLTNFEDGEMEYALLLLDSFLYFNQPTMDKLFAAAFGQLSTHGQDADAPYVKKMEHWHRFFDGVVVTRVQGEKPSDADSGFRFQRMARQVLGLAHRQIVSPDKAMAMILGKKAESVIFVDDFVGSGRQFKTTWQRKFKLDGYGAPLSFEDIEPHMRDAQFFFCPLICTDYAQAAIRKICPNLVFSPAHFLSSKYSALADNSRVWPDDLREEGVAFIENASSRAGIGSGWKGFHELGLTLAFEHCVPDATLPLFYWNRNGWKPLVERK